MSLGANRELNLDADGSTTGGPVIRMKAGSEISASKFFVSGEGQMTASAGLIAGFTIESGEIYNSSVTMSNADSYISLGAPGSEMYKDTLTGDGIRMSGSGQFRLGSNDEYILWDGSNLHLKSDNVVLEATDFAIDTDTFDLHSTNLIISSAMENGTIAAGVQGGYPTFPNYPTNISSSHNVGFFVNGLGDVLIGCWG